MTKEKNIEMETKLLNSTSVDELIKQKMEEEINEEFNKKNVKKEKSITKELNDVPKELIFSKKSVFKVYNRTNKTISYINGIQAEALIGLNNTTLNKIKNKETDTFATDGKFIKFEKAEI